MRPWKVLATILVSCATLAAAENGGAVTPQYGGTLNIGTIYVTLSALSFDPADWNWKVNHDAGMVYEQLFAADLEQSAGQGGPYSFTSEGWLPPGAIRGELAESWEWEDPLTVVVRLRRGIRFPDKPGVMASRELDARDVVWSFERIAASPKASPGYYDHVTSVEARDDHTVVFHFNQYNAEWDLRFGYGYYSAILPRELAAVDTRDWRNLVGTGPFRLTRFVPGSSSTYERNPDYWDRERMGDETYPIPFVDRVIYRTIKDQATQHTALRTGKIDILEVVPWLAVEYLEQTTPELQWARYLSSVGHFLALRVDREPFDDVRVRRALNMAIDKREIVEHFYGGNAELFAYPMHPDFAGYFEPLEEMPPSVQELFAYDPVKARRLLAEAGYPNGFRFVVQTAAIDPDGNDMLPLIAGYLAKVGVVVEIQPLEYAAFLSAMTTKTHAAGYLMRSGIVNPFTSLRKSFASGQTWNPSMWADPEYDRRIEAAVRERDESERQRKIRELTAEMVDQAPYVWLPTPYNYVAWWPWVRNYGGELRAGAVRPAPIYARIWIDHELKRKLGF
ncbi:MAG TPA: ABC transporter substrate-binding protein [Thermoanaerobaculia bacterium]|nr:ABC transporter substrate-binding protein [Thermoanaerobaculia bacterium]